MKKISMLIVAVCVVFMNIFGQERCINLNYCTQPRWVPHTVYDYTTMFNEKRYWLEIDQESGDVLICYQRIDVNPEYYITPNIHCYRASAVPVPPHLNITAPTRCWRAGDTTICRNEITGELILGKKPDNNTIAD